MQATVVREIRERLGLRAHRKGAEALRREALKLLADWKGLLGGNVAVSRQLLRKLLGGERFTIYPKGTAHRGWYEIGVRPTLDKFFDGLPILKKLIRPQRERTLLRWFGLASRRRGREDVSEWASPTEARGSATE
jgi:hypothetical protein